MLDVLQGFGVIGTIILLGFLAAKAKILPVQAQEVLGKLAFFVLTPSLLLSVLSQADWTTLFSNLFPVLFLTSLIMMALATVVWGLILRRDTATVVFAALGAGYVNSNNIGLPVAAYILGDPSLSAPIILYQTVIIAPIALAILDVRTGNKTSSWAKTLMRPLKNPMIIASAVGAFISWSEIRVPNLVLEPFSLLGQGAVPVLLLMLGWSMAGRNPLSPSPHRKDLFAISSLKLFIMPLVAWSLGSFWLGLGGFSLFTIVILAALPTAQNVFSYSVRYGRNIALTRDIVMVTTFFAAFVFIVITLLLI